MIRTATGLVLTARMLGEGGVVLTVFTEEFGTLSGLVKHASRQRAALAVGNTVMVTQRKRLDHQLGSFTLELLKQPHPGVLENFAALQCLQYMGEVLAKTLPEEQPYPAFYTFTQQFVAEITTDGLWQRLALWELQLLLTLGYGLSLSEDEAVTGEEASPLMYVSPKSGRAVSQTMGAAYADKLLPLPHLFGGPDTEEGQDKAHTFRLTGYFLEQALEGKRLQSRENLLQSL